MPCTTDVTSCIHESACPSIDGIYIYIYIYIYMFILYKTHHVKKLILYITILVKRNTCAMK